MNRLLILAILIISTVPLCAQGKHRKAVAVEPLPMCGSFQKPCVFKLLSKPYCWGCNTALDQARFVAWIKANPWHVRSNAAELAQKVPGSIADEMREEHRRRVLGEWSTTAAGSGGLWNKAHILTQIKEPTSRDFIVEPMTSQNALANAKLLFKALAAREANLDEPIPNIQITDVGVQIGLEGDEFDSALDYAADQGWFEDAEVGDSASWVSLTPAGVAAGKS